MENIICNNESGEKINIAESEFIAACIRPLGDMIGEILHLSETGRYLLVGIYPLMRNGEEWTPVNLLREIAKIPVLSQILKNRAILIHNLEGLTKLGILRKLEGDTMQGGRYALQDRTSKEIQFLDSVLFNPELRGFLEESYSYLYVITCTLARLVHTIFPTEADSRIFSLTATLMDTGIQLATQDLATHGVLAQQCSNCFYPYHPVDLGAEESEDGQLTEGAGQPADVPLYDQVKQFIDTSKAGKSKAEVLSHFAPLGYAEADTVGVLLDLINQGDARIDAGRYLINT